MAGISSNCPQEALEKEGDRCGGALSNKAKPWVGRLGERRVAVAQDSLLKEDVDGVLHGDAGSGRVVFQQA